MTPVRFHKHCLAPLLLAAPAVCLALPEGYSVNGGSANFSQNQQQLVIEQNSPLLSIDYNRFNIQAGERVQFIQPGVDAIALNRINDLNASEIYGQLSANGQIFLLNPNGILFGSSAQVDVGGLLATSANIRDEDFFSGNYQFQATETGAIINRGQLRAASGGYIALIASRIDNQGEVSAGDIILASSDQFVLTQTGTGIGIAASAATLQSAGSNTITNSGQLSAAGGRVLIQADGLDNLYRTAVNNSGVIAAQRIDNVGGEIVIQGAGDVINNGLIDASAASSNSAGGTIEIRADRIAQRGELRADGSGDGGRIELFAGDELFATSGSRASADGHGAGAGGEVYYYSPGATLFDGGGFISARGGEAGGDGGFVEVSGVNWVGVEGLVDTRARHSSGRDGTFLIDPTTITINAGATDNNGSFNPGGNWINSAASSEIGTDNITAQLALSDVVIDTASADGGGPYAGVGDINVNAAIDLNGGNGRSLTLRADRDLNINANICEGGGTCAFVDDSVDLVLISGRDLIIADGVSLDAGNRTIDIDTSGSATVTGLITRNTGASAVNIDAGDQIFQGGDSQLDIDAGTGSISLWANNGIAASGGDLRLQGGKLGVHNTATGSVNIHSVSDITVDALSVSPGGASITSIDSDGQLKLSAFGTSGELALSAAGNLTINDGLNINTGVSDITLLSTAADVLVTGLTSGGNVTVIASGNIIDGGDTRLDIQAGGATELSAGTGINGLEVNLNQLDASTSSGDLIIAEADSLTLTDLSANGYTLLNADGNIQLTSGDLTIDADIAAWDVFDDGVREGLIDIGVAGSLSAGTSGAVTIDSLSLVDEEINTGLGTDPSSNVSLRIRQLDNGNTTERFIFGDNSASDVLIRAQGGDILIDALGPASLSAGNTRTVELGSDVTVSSTSAAGGNSGSVVLDGVNNPSGASITAADGRSLLLRGSLANPVAPPVITPTTPLLPAIIDPLPLLPAILIPPPAADSDDDSIASLLNPVPTAAGDSVSRDLNRQSLSSARQFGASFGRAYGDCQNADNRAAQTNHCKTEQAMRRFLDSFLIGGEIPLGESND